jgi:large subunit ribosomal protein L10
MKREDKNAQVAELTEMLSDAKVIYLADTSGLNASATSQLRRECFKKGVQIRVVKNTLLRLAMEKIEGHDYSEMYGSLVGQTSVMIAEVGNVPAKLIKDFRKKSDRPALKAAYVEESTYIGDDQLTALTEIKSKDELLGELIGLLQSPAKNVISALKSSGGTIAGIVKTLSER